MKPMLFVIVLLLATTNLCHALDGSANQFLKETEVILPDGVTLTRVINQQSRMQLEGTARTNPEIAQFLLNLEQSGRFSTVELQESRIGDSGQRLFRVYVKRAKTSPP